MRRPVTVESHLAAPFVIAADVLPETWEHGGLVIDVAPGERPVRWAGRTEVLRRTGTWRRGRATGALVIDLLPVGSGRTVVSLRLDPPDRRLSAAVTTDDAWALLRAIRGHVEQTVRGHEPAAPQPLPVAVI